MLKVKIGYYDFIFPEGETSAALYFARTGFEHLSEEDSNREVSISFVNEKEETE